MKSLDEIINDHLKWVINEVHSRVSKILATKHGLILSALREHKNSCSDFREAAASLGLTQTESDILYDYLIQLFN